MQSFLSGGVKKQVWLGALLYLALSGSAFAQSTGTINGRVTDATDAVVAGATVTVTSTTTAVARNAVTNGEGLYSIPALHPGVYDVKAEMTGFAPSVKKGVTLITDTTLALDFSLAVAGTTQQVEVSGETVLVETTQSEVSGSLRTSEVQNLPMLNRNFTGLVTLVPGARPAAIYNPTKQAMGAAMSIGGGIGRNVEVNVDGGDNRDDIIGGPMQNYTIEGIQEFKLLSHEFGAQYGRTSGGVLQIATKSGTNSLHGTAFGYGRNDAMTAIDYFTKNSATPVKTPYSREQFGGSLGGPINKDRLFFFGAFERVQENYIQTELATSYAEAQALATVFPSIVVPALFIPEPFRDNMYTLKSDFQINSHHSVFVRWAQQINWKDNDSTSTTHADLTRTQTDRNHLWSIVASETWLIGSNSVNQFMIQRNDYDDYLKNNGPVVKGVPGYTPVTQNLSFPNLAIGRAQGADQEFIQKKWQFQDNFSHQMGKHALKFGGDFSFYPHISVIAGYLGCGSISFFDKPSVIINNTNGKYPKGFLTPGIVASISQNTCSVGGPLEDPGLVGAKQVGAYVADDWKVTPRLTWNLGLRYDVDINFFNQNLLPRSVNYQALQAIGSRYATPPHNGTYDFGPRVGFAWDIGGNALLPRNCRRGETPVALCSNRT